MRFRPANIRVINRRDSRLDHCLACSTEKEKDAVAAITRRVKAQPPRGGALSGSLDPATDGCGRAQHPSAGRAGLTKNPKLERLPLCS